MNIMLIDDDEAIRDMLQDIIEDYELGTVVASLPSAANITTAELIARHIDLLLIDMLMPDCDGIASVRRFQDFPGKIIMISQVDSKDLVGKAYESGIYAYITKPLNRNEIISVLRSVEEYIRLERFAHTLQSTLQTTLNPDAQDHLHRHRRAARRGERPERSQDHRAAPAPRRLPGHGQHRLDGRRRLHESQIRRIRPVLLRLR